MQAAGFEQALTSRVDDMLDACTKCGKCFEVCPIAGPAGLGAADPRAVVSGVLDILRFGTGPSESEKWAKACMASGECIKACDYGVNPRFLLTMARLAIMRNEKDPTERRQQGVNLFRKLGQDVGVLSRLQLSEEALIRLGQKPAKETARAELPDVVFYTGCNVLKTPHIALLCLDIMDMIGVDYKVMGGPTHCCGTGQLRSGDTETLARFAANTINKLSQSKTKQVLAWCPSCVMQFGETVLPTFERATGEMPFDMTPFMPFLHSKLDELRPFLKNRVEMTVALHRHPGIAGVMEAAEELLGAVPGIRIVKLGVPGVGLQSVNLATLPKFKAELQLKELEAARAAGVDALVAVYHSDHRELCAHERDWPFRIVNVLEIVGESMGFRQEDHYKNLKIKQDVDAIISDAGDLMKRHGLDLDTARKVIVNGMLADQPLPLQGRREAVEAR
ncbi:MAG: heterodisulfide reductase subunit [Alphaproteobacteria bacterium]|jgi:Fe-S oxidoreductase|nr:heterodisulfide reductase subunit [Alphaproteobacteria bacterium]